LAAIPPDYDTDPERWAGHDPGWLVDGDVHEMVAREIENRDLSPVLDVGSGKGRLGGLLPERWPWVGVDSSSAQLRGPQPGPVVRGDAAALPFCDGSFGAVAALWMLYHLEDPILAVAEARRLLIPGGVFFACPSSRESDPELTSGYPPSPFDAEDAPGIVCSVFGSSSTEVLTGTAL